MEVDKMRNYDTLNKILTKPENMGLTHYQVFKQPFEGKIENNVIREHYHNFLKQVQEDTAGIDAVGYWNHQQQNLMMYKMKGDRK